MLRGLKIQSIYEFPGKVINDEKAIALGRERKRIRESIKKDAELGIWLAIVNQMLRTTKS